MFHHGPDRITILVVACAFLFPLFSLTAPVQAGWFESGEALLDAVTKSPQNQTDEQGTNLTNLEVSSGLKDALRVGTETVVGQLGQMDGFNADPVIHIPLPDSMVQVKSALSAIGLSGMMDDLELKLNRAAEQATPPAKELFWDSIEAMTMDDVTAIYRGPDDAATRYFQDKMSVPLATAMRPIVENALSQVGAIQAYDAIMGEYANLPFVPDVKEDLNSYVVEQGMEGVFHYLAKEEAAIRTDPVKRTTDILQTVFGAE